VPGCVAMEIQIVERAVPGGMPRRVMLPEMEEADLAHHLAGYPRP
jgi:hypothetical protein